MKQQINSRLEQLLADQKAYLKSKVKTDEKKVELQKEFFDICDLCTSQTEPLGSNIFEEVECNFNILDCYY